jgi:hypothetical protein
MRQQVEEGCDLALKFDACGLVPAVTTDFPGPAAAPPLRSARFSLTAP